MRGGLIPTLGGVLLAGSVAAAPPPEVDRVDPRSVRVFTNGPWKGLHAVYQHPLVDVVVKKNLEVIIYPKDAGMRLGPPVWFEKPDFAFHDLHGKRHAARVATYRLPLPPQLQPAQLTFTGMLDNHADFGLTYQFTGSTIIAAAWLQNPDGARLPTELQFGVKWGKYKPFSDDVEQSERVRRLSECLLRAREHGADPPIFRIRKYPYHLPAKFKSCAQWAESRGPWGARKITVRRAGPGEGQFSLDNKPGACPWEGFTAGLTMPTDLKTRTESAQLVVTVE